MLSQEALTLSEAIDMYPYLVEGKFTSSSMNFPALVNRPAA